MDYPQLSTQLVQLLAPFLPYLVKGLKLAGQEAAKKLGEKAGEQGFEQAKALWDKLRRKKNVEQVAQTVAALPDNQALREALREEIARALAEDPALAQEMTRLMAQISAGERGVAAQTIENSTVITGDRNAVFGPGATGTIAVITGTVQQLSITGGPSAPAPARTTALPARADALAALAPHLPPEQRPQVLAEALAAAREIGDEYRRPEALANLAPPPAGKPAGPGPGRPGPPPAVWNTGTSTTSSTGGGWTGRGYSHNYR